MENIIFALKSKVGTFPDWIEMRNAFARQVLALDIKYASSEEVLERKINDAVLSLLLELQADQKKIFEGVSYSKIIDFAYDYLRHLSVPMRI